MSILVWECAGYVAEEARRCGTQVIVPLNGKDWGYLPAFPSPDCYTQDILRDVFV